MQLIAGLGNPDEVYKDTPHNIGFRTVDHLMQQLCLQGYQKRFKSDFQQYTENGITSFFQKPGTYMNRSGEPISTCARFFKIPPERILVICDDLDLSAGIVRFRTAGGHGGHNGLRSIIESMGSDKFLRARIGIGRPESRAQVTGYVLGNMEESRRKLYLMSIEIVVETLLKFVRHSSFKSTSISVLDKPSETPGIESGNPEDSTKG